MSTRSRRSKPNARRSNPGCSRKRSTFRDTGRGRRCPGLFLREKNMKIAVLPGDGIGSEIVAQAVRVLEALRRDGLKIELEQAPIGGAGYDAAQDPLPAGTLDLAKRADAVLLGAVGG